MTADSIDCIVENIQKNLLQLVAIGYQLWNLEVIISDNINILNGHFLT